MRIEMKTADRPTSSAEHGMIEGLDASIFTYPASSSCVLTQWSPVRSVTAHAPTRDEAIAEAVRMARACGMAAE